MPATARPTQAHSHAGGQAGTKPKPYNPRHPERTLLYQTIAEHFETWHELASAGVDLFSLQFVPVWIRVLAWG
nr:hypothetical protein [Rhodoferax sp.]